MSSQHEGLVQGTLNSFTEEQNIPVIESEQPRYPSHLLGRIAARGALVVGATLGLVAGETAALDHPSAIAETGGYPDAEAPCVANNKGTTQGSGYWCSDYQWGYYIRNSRGQITGNSQNSSRGYGYRNCTDWVAYRIPQLVQKSVPRGLGNAGQWDNNISGYIVDTTPEPGDIAVWDPTPQNSYGHVEVVESVNSDGTVNTSGYNKSRDGNYGTRAGVRANHYIDLNGTGNGITPETPPPPPPDTDHDGIIDAHDQCPTMPGIPGLSGCPPKDIDRDGIADLVIVNTANTGSGFTEAHELSGSGGYVNWFGHQATAVGYLNPNTQQVLVGDVSADHRPDLVVINTANTSTDKVEVHAMDGANGFSTWVEHAVTPLHYTDPSQKFALADINEDNRDDLIIINTQNTGSGKVEIHALDAAAHYTAWLGHWVTPADYLNPNTQQVLVGDANGDKRPDVLIVNTANTSSGLTEVHELNGANGFSTWQAHWVTPVGPLSPTQRLTMGDANADKIADLLIINTQNTGSGKVEIHPLSGATHYSSWLGHHIVTPLAALDSTQKAIVAG